jgi:flagellar biosynthesis/type III secretory pathway chaperone
MSDMGRMQDELSVLMRTKLDALRKADSDQIQMITGQEMKLVARFAERDGLRRQLMNKCQEALDISGPRKTEMRLSELAEYLAEPQRSQLLTVAAGMKDRAQELERMRVKTALVTEEVLKHMEHILKVMTAGAGMTGTYSRAGQEEPANNARVFEAVG